VSTQVSTDALAAAFASTRAVMLNVTPAEYDKPTPCASWDVRALINHIVAGSHYFAATARAGEPPTQVEPPDFTEDDPLLAFDAGITATLTAFAAPDVGSKTITLPFGTMPGAAFMRIATVDTFAHGWDLAKATGQDADLAPDLALELLAGARESLPDALRGPDGECPFGPVVEVPDSAPAADQLAAFLGRKP
jgi:uncharacterized protein (TIGR03086 family)